MINWLLEHGIQMAGVIAAWLALGAAGTAVLLTAGKFLADIQTHALERRIQRRKQWMEHELAEGKHLAAVEDLKVKLARPAQNNGTGLPARREESTSEPANRSTH